GSVSPLGDALSPDHSWLASERDGTLVLHDLHHGARPGFSFQPPPCRHRTIHPSGEMLGVRTDNEVLILLPDGEVLTRVPFPGKEERLANEALTFSACGKYLWFAHIPAEGAHCLVLMRVPTLQVLERAPVPYDPGSYYDGPD